MHKISRPYATTTATIKSAVNGSPQQQRKSESETDYRSVGKNRSAPSSTNSSQTKPRATSSDLNNNDEKKNQTSSGSTDRAKALADSAANIRLAKEESWDSSESGGSATDDDIGDVWDEEASFEEDEVEGFDEDEDGVESFEDDQAPPPAPDEQTNYATGPDNGQEAVNGGACLNIWNLEDIPEEEAAELLAVVNAAEEYLSSVASGGAKRLRSVSHSSNGRNNRSKKTAGAASVRPPSGVEIGENAEEIIHRLPTVAANFSYQRKQKHTETGGANEVAKDDRVQRDNKSQAKTCPTTAHLTSSLSKIVYSHSTLEPADSREEISNISMDSQNSSKNRSYRGCAPQLSIFSVGETKFPDSPTNSRRETLSNASQSSRLSARSHRSIDRSVTQSSKSHRPKNPTDRPVSQFKVSKSIKAIQIEANDQIGQSKFRVSPPPPIPDFRPGSPKNDQSPPPGDETVDGPPKRQSLDKACLSKLADDIERLLAQLDNELPEEKTRLSAVIRDHDRLETAECTLDKTDFRKCYCQVLSVSTHQIDSGAEKSAFSPAFLSPSSDGGDLTFYSGDDGEASLILDNSVHLICSVLANDMETENHDQKTDFTVAPREKADSVTISAKKPLPPPEEPKPAPPEPKLTKTSAEKAEILPSAQFIAKYSVPATDSNVGYRFTPSADKDGSTRFRYTCYASASTRLPALTRSYVSTIPPRRSASNVRVHTGSEEIFSSLGDQDEIKKKFADKIRDLEKLLGQERDLRNVAEQSEQNARKRVEQVEWKLEQAEKQAFARAELDARRESDLTRLRGEAEKARRDHQAALDSLRKKQAEVIACIEDQLNAARAERLKAERECAKLRAQLYDAEAGVEILNQDKQNLENQKNKMELKSYEYQLKVAELQNMLAEAAGARQKINAENDKLSVEIRESQSQVSDIDRKRIDLQRQVDLLTATLNDEIKKRQSLSDRVKHLEKENETLREINLQDDEKKKELTRQLTRSSTEILSLQTKLEQCSLAQAELLEQQKNYYTNKLSQARQENETLSGRIASLERIRAQLKQEIEELTLELEKANSSMSGYDKRVITLDKTVREWEQKYNELSGKVIVMEDELRTATSELQRSKKQVEEAVQEAAVLKKENQKFREELHGLQIHVSDVTAELRQAKNLKKRLTEEKDELEKMLQENDTETVSRSKELSEAQTVLSNVQDQIDAKVREKMAEFEQARRSLGENMEELKKKFGDEKRNREAADKQQQTVEKRVKELENLLENANKARMEALDRVKRITEQNQDLSVRLEKLKRDHASAIEKCAVAEKRAGILQKEREEMAAALVQVERSRQELIEETSALRRDVAEHEVALGQLKVAKQEIESAADDARANLELATQAAAVAEEKATEFQAERANLIDELKTERQKAIKAEQTTSELESTIKELQNKIERLERNALMSTEHAVARLEQTVRDLETELKQERQKAHDALRSERGSERLIKELQFQMEQERLQANRMADVVENLEHKLKVYRRQREEAEEMANANLARCRELQQNLDNVEGRADAAENVLSRMRAENRGRISGLMTTAPVTTEVISPVTRRTLTTTLSKRPQPSTVTTKSRISSSYR